MEDSIEHQDLPDDLDNTLGELFQQTGFKLKPDGSNERKLSEFDDEPVSDKPRPELMIDIEDDGSLDESFNKMFKSVRNQELLLSTRF